MNRREFCTSLTATALLMALPKTNTANINYNKLEQNSTVNITARGDFETRIEKLNNSVQTFQHKASEIANFNTSCKKILKEISELQKNTNYEKNNIASIFYNEICPKQKPEGTFPNNELAQIILKAYEKNLVLAKNNTISVLQIQNFDLEINKQNEIIKAECRSKYPFSGNFSIKITQSNTQTPITLRIYCPEASSLYSIAYNNHIFPFKKEKNYLETTFLPKENDTLTLHFGIELNKKNNETRFGILQFRENPKTHPQGMIHEEKGRIKCMNSGRIHLTKYSELVS